MDFVQNLIGNLLIITYQLTKFQAPSSNSFQDILLTILKCSNLQRAIALICKGNLQRAITPEKFDGIFIKLIR